MGTLWLLGEGTIHRYVSDPLVRRHPNAFGIKLVRASLNPPASLANILRGHFPWWRDYEHPNASESLIVKQFEGVLDAEQKERGDLYLHYRSLSLGNNNGSCFDCRNVTTGAGLKLGVAARRYLDVIADVSVQPGASPVSSLNAGGSLTTANFSVRSGYSAERFAVKVSLAPGFASYSRTQPVVTESNARGERSISPPLQRFGRPPLYGAPGISGDLGTDADSIQEPGSRSEWNWNGSSTFISFA